MLEREPLRAEERARQAARPEVLALELRHLRGEPLGRDEPLDLCGHQISRALRHRRDVVPVKGTRRPRGPHKWKAALTFLAKQGDNGIVWNILSYWRATS